jgi:GT2 family glycosyltransferase
MGSVYIMEQPKVIIIILNWNRAQDTIECIDSIKKLLYENYEIIVIDNHSNDSSPGLISERYADVTLINNSRNLGFAGGNNLGIKCAAEKGYDYLWFINNDLIVDEESLGALIGMASKVKRLGMISPVIYYHDWPTEIQFCGSYVDWDQGKIVYPPRKTLDIDGRFSEGKDVCLWGTALLVKKELIETIGGLKDSFFAYWEDTEYSLRAIKAGFKNRVCESAKVYHKGVPPEVSPVRENDYYFYYMTRNKYLVDREYFENNSKSSLFRNYIAYMLEMMAHCKYYEYREGVDACLEGAWDAMHGMFGEWDKRKKAPYIFKIFIKCMKHPYFLAHCLRGEFGTIYKLLTMRLRKAEMR